MLVVSIIGILAALGMPNFIKFQRKAKQSEAREMLNSYYVALKSSAAETGCFRGNFIAIGFQPEGELNYRLTTSHNASCNLPTATASIDDPSCIVTSDACDGITTNYAKTWVEKNTVGNGAAAETVSNNAFLASCAGDLGAGVNDEWTITETKTLANPINGL